MSVLHWKWAANKYIMSALIVIINAIRPSIHITHVHVHEFSRLHRSLGNFIRYHTLLNRFLMMFHSVVVKKWQFPNKTYLKIKTHKTRTQAWISHTRVWRSEIETTALRRYRQRWDRWLMHAFLAFLFFFVGQFFERTFRVDVILAFCTHHNEYPALFFLFTFTCKNTAKCVPNDD